MKNSKKKQFAVIGLGRFGGSICKELHALGHEVLAIDKEEEKVQEFAPYCTHAVQADSTDEGVLRNSGINNFDHVVVAIGDNIQASILTTLVLKDLGIEKVWAKAQNAYHQKVLDKIGADLVVHPEFDMGIRIAHNMSSERIVDFIDLSDEYSIIELLASDKLHGKSLAELDLRAAYSITVLAYRNEKGMNISPAPEDKIKEGELLVVMGHKKDLARFEEEGM
ncbi:TrkA family potassium uptake protein [Paenalkalicoccus suaedae]|uniref:TrkA family potassium uptake protein n=1 Tax=Paenalkalicoccus suaedae TaxID=2592382 RepID=A0A859FKN0_9BACI|nr:TrkA family potassium uptake protein [Paenalkalicoccus suaedae]QKS73336.1 TrkA family potassium uptake protein [Paenalkalicoccus suaedae]